MPQPNATSDTAINTDKGSRKITHRPSAGTAKLLSKATLGHNATSDTAINTDKGSQRITHRPSAGTAKPPNEEMPRHNTISGYVMKMVKA